MYTDYDYRFYRALLVSIQNGKNAEFLKNKLATAEAFNFAYIGSLNSKGSKDYGKWQSKVMNQIRKLNGEKVETFWDRLGRKSRKF